MGIEAGSVNKGRKRNEIVKKGKQTTRLRRLKLVGKVALERVLQSDQRTNVVISK